MDTLNKILKDGLTSLVLATRATIRIAGALAPYAARAARATVRAGAALVGLTRTRQFRSGTAQVRKTAKRGRRAMEKLADEAEARRTGRGRTTGRTRRWGIVGAAVAGAIGVILYLPQKLMRSSEPQPSAEYGTPAVSEPPAESIADQPDVATEPADPIAQEATPAVIDGESEAEPRNRREPA